MKIGLEKIVYPPPSVSQDVGPREV